MTVCDKFNELLSAAIDGEITPDEEKELISHMEACNECSSLFESLRVLSNEFSDMLIDPPEALLSGIMEKIKNRGQMDRRKFGKKRFFMMGGRLAAAAAVIVLVLFAADTFGTSRKSPAEKEMPADYAMKTAEEDSCDVPENESSLKYDEEYTRK
jgi:anti-sigma factor RsiW